MKQECQIIDGKAFAASYAIELLAKLKELKQKHHIVPGLSVVLVGDDPASLIYVKNKIKRAEQLGMHVFFYHLPANTSQKILTAKIEHLNNDILTHGILVQLPLPAHLDAFAITNLIDHKKDVDGFTIHNTGMLNLWQDCLMPCTPQGALLLIKKVLGNELYGKKAVVIGRSTIVGRPMSSMLIRESCSVTVLNSHSLNLLEECRSADIIVSATGNANMIKANWVKPGACVIDVGIIRVEDKLYGDVDFEEVKQVAGYLTPVPGGVGPMTVICMLANTIKAACMQKNIVLYDA